MELLKLMEPMPPAGPVRPTAPSRLVEHPAPKADRKLVSVVVPCYNEEENVVPLCEAVRRQFTTDALLDRYDYEILFIDNASQDRTVPLLKELAAADRRVKVIVNMRNFGPVRSPVYALFQTRGEAIIPMCADFQDPPDMIPGFLSLWEQGNKVVAAIKQRSEEGRLMGAARRLFYRTLSRISETELLDDFTGYGLYDRVVIDRVKSTGDHYPYVRGWVCEMGYPIARVPYVRPDRKRGISKNRLYSLYGQAMTAVTSHSKVPLRMATFTGFLMACFSLFVAVGYFIYKLIFWNSFQLGLAPLVIGLFFFAAVQLMFLGIIGEYIGAIHSRVFQKWLVIEKERINFD